MRPSGPKYAETWDPGIVLQYLRTQANNLLSLEQFTCKLATLLALATGQRVQTLSNIELSNIRRSNNRAPSFETLLCVTDCYLLLRGLTVMLHRSPLVDGSGKSCIIVGWIRSSLRHIVPVMHRLLLQLRRVSVWMQYGSPRAGLLHRKFLRIFYQRPFFVATTETADTFATAVLSAQS